MRELVNQRRVMAAAFLLMISLLALAGCGPRQPDGPAFDIPSLIGKKLPALEKQLGAAQPEADNGENGASTFTNGDYLLRVDYRKSNGRVISLTLTFADPSRSVKEHEKNLLLQAGGGLQEGDNRYSVESIESLEKMFAIAGLRITPAPVRHKVELRVKSTAMVTVRYTAPPEGAPGGGAPSTTRPGESFLTIPPWNTTFEAMTGTMVGIEAGPSGMTPPSGSGYDTTTVQIVVDGKLAGQFTSNGGTAHCELELD